MFEMNDIKESVLGLDVDGRSRVRRSGHNAASSGGNLLSSNDGFFNQRESKEIQATITALQSHGLTRDMIREHWRPQLLAPGQFSRFGYWVKML